MLGTPGTGTPTPLLREKHLEDPWLLQIRASPRVPRDTCSAGMSYSFLLETYLPRPLSLLQRSKTFPKDQGHSKTWSLLQKPGL